MTSAAESNAAYDRLWSKIAVCETCKFDRRIDPKIREHWKEKDAPFLPFPGVGPEPQGLPVRYLLVGEEPSLRPKNDKKTREDILRRIATGKRNFRGDAHTRFAPHKWLVEPGEAFVMTDIGKCILPVKEAMGTRRGRYGNCSHWLEREVALFPTLRAIVPMSRKAHTWLRALAQSSWPPITKPIWHPAFRFARLVPGKTDTRGLPTVSEFAEYVRLCDPESKMRLDDRRRALLARWQVQFREIRAALGGAQI